MTVTLPTFFCFLLCGSGAVLGMKGRKVQRVTIHWAGGTDGNGSAYCTPVTAECRGNNRRGMNMKTMTILAIALGLGSLAACNKSAQEQAADNYEANVDNAADQMESNMGNAADQMTANADNAADAMKSAADNKADAMKDAADNKADAIANNAQ
jgi:hypothetical protein